MEKIVYVDPSGREWVKGGTPNTHSYESGTWVILPFWADAMHPVPLNDDTMYSTCVKCGKSLERGLVTLLFDQQAWGVRLVCCVVTAGTAVTTHPIIYIASILEPLILNAWKEVNYQCTVCTRSRCNDVRCQKMLERGIIKSNPVLDHFYNVKLNVLTPLVDFVCANCKNPDATKLCKVCRIVVFCSRKCKKISGHTKCQNHYYDIWNEPR